MLASKYFIQLNVFTGNYNHVCLQCNYGNVLVVIMIIYYYYYSVSQFSI